MTTLAIGDVQGCFDQLKHLLKLARYNADRDRLWFCGDLVNRGPKSLQVLRFVRDLGDGAVTVLGNHDLHLISLARQAGSVRERSPTLAPVLAARDGEQLIEWLAGLPFYHYDKTLKSALVHAGVPPGWTRKQTKKRAERLRKQWRDSLIDSLRDAPPPRWHGKLTRADKLRFTCAALTRMRFVDDKGIPEYSAKGHPDNYAGFLNPWFEFMHEDWHDTRVFFGHWSTLGDTGRNDVIALDSGCVWGRALTAVTVKPPGKRLHEFVVDCDELAARP